MYMESLALTPDPLLSFRFTFISFLYILPVFLDTKTSDVLIFFYLSYTSSQHMIYILHIAFFFFFAFYFKAKYLREFFNFQNGVVFCHVGALYALFSSSPVSEDIKGFSSFADCAVVNIPCTCCFIHVLCKHVYRINSQKWDCQLERPNAL